MTSLMWFRRDLRTRDHPAFAAAAETGPVLALFVVDPVLFTRHGSVRQQYLRDSVAALDDQVGGRLLIVRGDPKTVIPQVARAAEANSVHITRDFGAYGKARDRQVGETLAAHDIQPVATGSNYAVAPGAVTTGSGGRYKVFTPFFRAWQEHGWHQPHPTATPNLVDPADLVLPKSLSIGLPQAPKPMADLPTAGEQAALKQWHSFRDNALADYDDGRNVPSIEGTSNLSAHLRWGEIHPRTVLADLASKRSDGAETFRKEIAWREFFADVWDANPQSTWKSLDRRFDDDLQIDKGKLADEQFQAWCEGKTGYPIVDAGMRQLLATGWMHNRVRMITASFLTKHLHQPWQRGAAWFMERLRDGDAASNQQNWQWVAGAGADAAPYYRIFNPTRQGLTFDPDGAYVHEWVPELRGLTGKQTHEPWRSDSPDLRYCARIVDLAAERDEALQRFSALPPRESDHG